MYSLEEKITEAKVKSVEQIQARAQLSQDLVNIHDTLDKTEINLDIENAKLEEVSKNQEALNNNIATLIMGLDEVTSKFGADFAVMRENTKLEKFVGFFSKTHSTEMRTERIRNADISSNLNNLISQSNSIVVILQDQERVLSEQLTKGKENLSYTIEKRKETVEQLEDNRNSLNEMDPKIIDLESRISEETDVLERTALEGELHLLNQSFNEFKNEEQKLLVRSQTLEKYISMNKTNVDSLQNQRTAQQVLIDKLKTDTAQRVILFEQYQHSLKTAQQQDTAHRLNEIGSEVDKATQAGMAHIAAATNNRMMEMMERHEGDMISSADIMEKKQRADERFLRRFKSVVEKHDSAIYGSSE